MPSIRKLKPRSTSITAQYVGKLAGVSQSTVSRVLNGRDNAISEETRHRVVEVATQLGYSPDPIARALRGKQTFLLGLIVREIADPFFAKLIASPIAFGPRYHSGLYGSASEIRSTP